MEAGPKEVGDFCYLAKSPTLLAPSSATAFGRGVAYIYEEGDQSSHISRPLFLFDDLVGI